MSLVFLQNCSSYKKQSVVSVNDLVWASCGWAAEGLFCAAFIRP